MTLKTIKESIQASIDTKNALLNDDTLLQQVSSLADRCTSALKAGGKIIFCGNGGSFADAQHLSAEFTSRFFQPLNEEAKEEYISSNKEFSDEKIVGGECSTPGITSLVGLSNNDEVKKTISLNEDSSVLLFGCEGDADEELYQKLLAESNHINLKNNEKNI